MQNLRIPFILHCLTGGLDFRASKAGPCPQAWVLYAAPIAGNRWWMGSKRSLSGKVKRKNVPTRWVNWVPPLSQRQWAVPPSSRLPLPSFSDYKLLFYDFLFWGWCLLENKHVNKNPLNFVHKHVFQGRLDGQTRRHHAHPPSETSSSWTQPSASLGSVGFFQCHGFCPVTWIHSNLELEGKYRGFSFFGNSQLGQYLLPWCSSHIIPFNFHYKCMQHLLPQLGENVEHVT